MSLTTGLKPSSRISISIAPCTPSSACSFCFFLGFSFWFKCGILSSPQNSVDLGLAAYFYSLGWIKDLVFVASHEAIFSFASILS